MMMVNAKIARQVVGRQLTMPPLATCAQTIRIRRLLVRRQIVRV